MDRRPSFFRSRAGRASLVVAGLATVVVAPLAAPSTPPASAVVIEGATSLADRVAVQFANAPADTTDVHLLAYNDFHGTLDPGTQNIYGRFAGGAAYLAKLVKERQALHPLDVTVFAGDNIGASQLANNLFNEEPATIISNLMFTDIASVGNHEFDRGATELRRIQEGGCPASGCNGAPYALAGGGTSAVFPGADFQYLSTNVVVTATGRTLFPATAVKKFKGGDGRNVKVGFIGEVLESTPTIVTPTGVAGLRFRDEADAANEVVASLKEQGAKTIVLVIHEGGFQTTGAALNGCAGNLAGSAIADIASRLDPAIKVIVSAHTHAEYRCTITIGGVTRLVTSASSFGRILTDITLTIDRTGELAAAEATNLIVENALNAFAPGVARQPDTSREDPQVKAVVNQYVTAAAPLANRLIGSITADLTRTPTSVGESVLGDIIADAQLAATRTSGGAQIAFMNPGGIRADFSFAQSPGGEAPGQVTYGEAFTVQPFGNSLVTKTMTGTQIRALLEQQFIGCRGQLATRILQVSEGFSYVQNPAGPCDGRTGDLRLNGVAIDPAATYRVTMNSFLAAGGDGFTEFNGGTNPVGGDIDIDALVAYFGANSPLSPTPRDRIIPAA